MTPQWQPDFFWPMPKSARASERPQNWKIKKHKKEKKIDVFYGPIPLIDTDFVDTDIFYTVYGIYRLFFIR